MDFLAVILFLVLYFVRPQDWVPGLEGLNVIKPVIALGVVGLISRERRFPRWRVLTTPHEWVMVAYLAYGLYVDPDWVDTSTAIATVAAFYFLTSQTLTDSDRLVRFCCWWAGCIVFMCIVGVAVDLGVDLTKARELIEGQNGRLCLNTSLLDNPNALGHTAGTAFPLVYFTMVFRRDIAMKLLSAPLFLAVGMCVVATESKGAYLSSAASIFAALLVGRPFFVQVVVATVLATGSSFISAALPRMADTTAMQYDEGIMGRALAFVAARASYQLGPVGWSRFTASIDWLGETVEKATHSSFVQIGADMGPIGLFLFVAILTCASRSLLTMRTESEDLERCRRLLFALVVGYFVSGWMINRSYHTELYLLTGAIVAFHKLAREQRAADAGLALNEHGEVEKEPEVVPVFGVQQTSGNRGSSVVVRTEQVNPLKKMWNRIGVLDFAITYGVFSFVVWFWDYLIDFFIPS